jgi:anthranilate phosphoribosyltransferase
VSTATYPSEPSVTVGTRSAGHAPLPELSGALEALAAGEDLGRHRAGEVVELLMQGRVGDVQAAAFLMALRAKGETIEEVVGFAMTMRRLGAHVDLGDIEGVVDVVGTGGDRLQTFNISTTAAFVVAAAGVPVAKHGNRGITSRSGSADLLEALGVRLDLTCDQVAACVRRAGVGFMFAPRHHQAMRHLASVRRDLGVPTVLNLLGPLTNPAGARRLVVGVGSARHGRLVAEVLHALGTERALVVHGAEGMDEFSVVGPSAVIAVDTIGVGSVQTVVPEELGLRRWPLADLLGGDPVCNAGITRAVLAGEPGAPLEATLLNAGAGIVVGGRAATLAQGVALARAAIESGAAERVLADLVRESQSFGGNG